MRLKGGKKKSVTRIHIGFAVAFIAMDGVTTSKLTAGAVDELFIIGVICFSLINRCHFINYYSIYDTLFLALFLEVEHEYALQRGTDRKNCSQYDVDLI